MIPKQKKLHKFLLYYRLFLEVVLGEVGYKTISVPANSGVPLPIEDLTDKAFTARNATSSSLLSFFYKAGSGPQFYRVAGTSTGLSINDETPLSLHISRVDGSWVITNNTSSVVKFQYKVLL